MLLYRKDEVKQFKQNLNNIFILRNEANALLRASGNHTLAKQNNLEIFLIFRSKYFLKQDFFKLLIDNNIKLLSIEELNINLSINDLKNWLKENKICILQYQGKKYISYNQYVKFAKDLKRRCLMILKNYLREKNIKPKMY